MNDVMLSIDKSIIGSLPRRSIFTIYCCGCCLVVALCSSMTYGQQRRAPKAASADSVATQFDQLRAQATQARESNRVEEAIDLYRRALKLRPQWSEGWWYLATLLYDRDEYTEAVNGFERASKLQPKVGATWGMLGLCEYQLGRYDEALAHLQQGDSLGINNPEVHRVMRYHGGILLNYKGEFESAQRMLNGLSYEGMNSENLIIAHGLSVLRLPILPNQVDADKRQMIRRAGWAEHLAAQSNVGEAQREYERLVADFPQTPNIQYAYGRFLLTLREDEKAIAAFEREIANFPNHAMARFQIAFVKMNNKDAAGGLEMASQAVKLNPQFALGRYLLGRLFFETNQNPRAIEELETARRLAPNESRIYFTLARAYERANRKADADIARATFTRLNRLAEGDHANFMSEDAKAKP